MAHAKAISGPIQGLGINRINHHSVIQQKIDDSPLRLLDSRPKLYPSALRSWSQRPNSVRPSDLLHLHLGYFLALVDR